MFPWTIQAGSYQGHWVRFYRQHFDITVSHRSDLVRLSWSWTSPPYLNVNIMITATSVSLKTKKSVEMSICLPLYCGYFSMDLFSPTVWERRNVYGTRSREKLGSFLVFYHELSYCANHTHWVVAIKAILGIPLYCMHQNMIFITNNSSTKETFISFCQLKGFPTSSNMLTCLAGACLESN